MEKNSTKKRKDLNKGSRKLPRLTRADGLDAGVWGNDILTTEDCIVLYREIIIRAIHESILPRNEDWTKKRLAELWISDSDNFSMCCEHARWNPEWIQKIRNSLNEMKPSRTRTLIANQVGVRLRKTPLDFFV